LAGSFSPHPATLRELPARKINSSNQQSDRPMRIVSIMPGHNATVGYFENGRCMCVLQEEKFSNIKNHFGFPVQSFDYLQQQVALDTIHYFCFSGNTLVFIPPTENPEAVEQSHASGLSRGRRIYERLEYQTGWKWLFSGIRDAHYALLTTPRAWEAMYAFLHSRYNISRERVLTVDHHLSHALTPLKFFGLDRLGEDVLLMTMDGAGDFAFAKVFIFRSNDRAIIPVASSHWDASIGLIYQEVTRFLGMKPLEHEYKVMGLAAYVREEKHYRHIYNELSEIVWLDETTLSFHSRFNTKACAHFMAKRFRYERFDNIAAAAQKLSEDLVLAWVRAAIRKLGIRTVAFSGGVFMNVKMNQKIAGLPEVRRAFFQPSCGDESLVIGAACFAALQEDKPFEPVRTVFSGPAYTDAEVGEFIRSKGLETRYRVQYFQDIEREIAQLLADMQVVARFKGPAEWGARSLCNRGILGNASTLETFHQVNDMIKMRDFWMPFAPTILDTWASRYLRDWETLREKCQESLKYMIVTCDSTELAQSHLRAAIHQKDKTLRPQLVEKSDNVALYKLLEYFEELTGMGGFLNTSLNLHGYPLVGTLDQALFTFENSGLRHLAIENWLISKMYLSGNSVQLARTTSRIC